MKRWFVKIVVFLLLGAVVNVAVAWACAAWVDPYLGEHYQADMDEGVWAVEKGSGLGLIVVLSWWWGNEGAAKGTPPRAVEKHLPTWAPPTPVDSTLAKTVDTSRTDIAAGWPYLALAGEAIVRYAPGPARRPLSVQASGIEISAFGLGERYRLLPLKPLWPGFWLNTILYALVTVALWLCIGEGSRRIHRILRRKRGLCIKCGYDLRGDLSSGCPECGWERKTPSPISS